MNQIAVVILVCTLSLSAMDEEQDFSSVSQQTDPVWGQFAVQLQQLQCLEKKLVQIDSSDSFEYPMGPSPIVYRMQGVNDGNTRYVYIAPSLVSARAVYTDLLSGLPDEKMRTRVGARSPNTLARFSLRATNSNHDRQEPRLSFGRMHQGVSWLWATVSTAFFRALGY